MFVEARVWGVGGCDGCVLGCDGCVLGCDGSCWIGLWWVEVIGKERVRILGGWLKNWVIVGAVECFK